MEFYEMICLDCDIQFTIEKGAFKFGQWVIYCPSCGKCEPTVWNEDDE